MVDDGMENSIEELNSRFPGSSLRFVQGKNGLVCCRISNAFGKANVYLQGAHVVSYCPHGKDEVLWMSPESMFEPGRAIRGGIPICWPWFGPHPGDNRFPQHGFARTCPWAVRAVLDTDHSTELFLGLLDDEHSRRFLDGRFDARYRVSVGSELTVELSVTNTGTDPLRSVGCALHSYFAIGDVTKAYVEGLEDIEFLDKLSGQKVTQSGRIAISDEVDRVYSAAPDPIRLIDNVKERMILVSSQGSQSTVVWNPWIEKSKRMTDFPDDGYQSMTCIETANALKDVRTIQPGDTHVIAQTIRLADLSGYEPGKK